MADRACEFCGDPLEGMRADAKFHPECKDRARREKERRDGFEDMLRAQVDASLAEAERIRERVDELLTEWEYEKRVTEAAIYVLDRLHSVRRRPLWVRLWASVWRSVQDDPAVQAHLGPGSPDNGRTGAQNDG